MDDKEYLNQLKQKLALMRMEIQALKGRLCQDLDAMTNRLDRLLPPEDAMRYQKYKNYTREDWRKFLGGGPRKKKKKSRRNN